MLACEFPGEGLLVWRRLIPRLDFHAAELTEENLEQLTGSMNQKMKMMLRNSNIDTQKAH
jgi:hypothetical protein